MSGRETDEDLDPTSLELGRLIHSFHNLELLLRVYLHNTRTDRSRPAVDLRGLEAAQAGELVPLNEFTDYRSLTKLVEVFNIARPGREVDSSLVAIRDALAHGRVYAIAPRPPLRLLKFGPATGDRVPVECNIELTPAWLIVQRRRLNRALDIVATAINDATPGAVGHPGPDTVAFPVVKTSDGNNEAPA